LEKTKVVFKGNKEKPVKERILKLYFEHNGIAGSSMITAGLKEKDLSNAIPNTVASIMREMGLNCKTTKKFILTTDSKHNKPVA